jgi:hypothetical protein
VGIAERSADSESIFAIVEQDQLRVRAIITKTMSRSPSSSRSARSAE